MSSGASPVSCWWRPACGWCCNGYGEHPPGFQFLGTARNQDFADLFAALNAAEARYLLVGGYAVAFHAEPRFTKDLDIWVGASPGNATRVHNALAAFGAPLSGITPSDLATMGQDGD